MISGFIKLYKINMNEALFSDINHYTCFNDFFKRELKDGARKWVLAKENVLSPVDGKISQIGKIYNSDQLIQAKGKSFNLGSLLANNDDMTNLFRNGSYTVLYLSPRDYHRIHMPIAGKILKSIYVPGDLFAVNKPSVKLVDGLFARNERFITLIEYKHGLMIKIMVGALFVGSMDTVWTNQILPPKQREITTYNYENKNITLKQGELFGNFNMGSTVILLFQENKMQWLSGFETDDPVKVGQLMGKIT